MSGHPLVAHHSYQGISFAYGQSENAPSPVGPFPPSPRMVRDWKLATETLSGIEFCRGDEFTSNGSAGPLPVPHTAIRANNSNGPVSQPEMTNFQVGRAQKSSSMDPANSLSMVQQPIGSVIDICGEQTSVYPTGQRSDLDWSTFLNLSPEIQPFDGTPTAAFVSSQTSDSQNSFNYDLAPPLLEENGIHSQMEPQDESRSWYNLACISTSSSITLEGANPEDIVSSLHALHSNFPMHLVRHELDGYLYSDSHLASLLDMVNSTWLHLEIENILCWSYEMSARKLRQRQVSRQDCNFNSRPGSSYLGSNHDYDRGRPDTREVHNGQVFLGAKPKLKSFLMRVTPSSTLRIQLWTDLQGCLEDVRNPEPHNWLRVTFIARESKRSKGLTVEFTITQGDFPEPCLCRCIKAFNVVPENSEVIQCVSRNDLPGLQKLFDNRKASPLDVDPRGYSLLSASLTSDSLVRSIRF